MTSTPGQEIDSTGSDREALMKPLGVQPATGEPQNSLRELLIEGLSSPEGPLADVAYFDRLKESLNA